VSGRSAARTRTRAGRADRRATPASPTTVARRDAIVHVAFTRIAERGLEGLRFADVAREAGINNGTLLYYFASKDALIQAVGAYLVDQYSQSARREGVADPFSDPLLGLAWEFDDARARLGDALGVVYAELLARAQRDTSIAEVLRDIDEHWRGWLVTLLSAARERGLIRPDLELDLIAATMMAGIRGVGMQTLVSADTAIGERLMDSMRDQLLSWLRPPGS
jgi:AcrR family transcriptional regulator